MFAASAAFRVTDIANLSCCPDVHSVRMPFLRETRIPLKSLIRLEKTIGMAFPEHEGKYQKSCRPEADGRGFQEETDDVRQEVQI